MIVATNVELRPLFGELLDGRSGPDGCEGLLSSRSGTWVVEPSTWIRPAARPGGDGDLEVFGGLETARPVRMAANRPPLAPGDRLGGYRLLERLGRGGQGDVWKAMRRVPFTELVALKVLKPSLSRDPARMAQFRREAERGGRLAGPSLLPVYELNAVDGYHFMTMPYVEGITLREVIRARTAHLAGKPTEEIHGLVTLDEPDYLRTMTRILCRATEALARAHDQRVAHRDIKPANILLDNRRPDGVYLCDFGLGRDLEIATPQQMRDGAGTPMYMAPERLLRAAADEIKCDIYSMGVTLFEALTLSRPFHVPDHVTFSSLPAFLAGTPPRRPGEVHRGFPEDIEAVVLKAMERDPARRYDAADELVADLRRLEVRWTLRTRRVSFDGSHGSYVPGPHSRLHPRGDGSRRAARPEAEDVA